ncbi:MAG: DUF6134 family protein [Bacteroidota bacterium]|nr:DUF6134 family protein [Kiloniellaceae bacterium]
MLTLLGGGVAGLCLPGAAALACGPYPAADGWRFDVLRHGDVIGEHVFAFSRDGQDFVVEVAIDIAVGMLGITLFRFTHRAEEVWRDGRLRSLATATDDDGTPWRVDLRHRDGALHGSVNGDDVELPGDAIPASLWHRGTTTAPALLDTIDGRMKAVTSQTLGEGTAQVGATEAAARRFRLTGQLQRDVWYGADCSIARVTFPARDGSEITLARR